MNLGFVALERSLAALESSRTAFLRFDPVTGVSGGKAKMVLPHGQRVNSFENSTIQSSVLKGRDIKMPDISEPVACPFSGQGCEQGVVLVAYYNARRATSASPRTWTATAMPMARKFITTARPISWRQG